MGTANEAEPTKDVSMKSPNGNDEEAEEPSSTK